MFILISNKTFYEKELIPFEKIHFTTLTRCMLYPGSHRLRRRWPKDGGKKEQQVLNIYSWADYFDPQVLATFEKANNCRINYDVYSNNEELLAKMQAGGAQFDIIQPSDYMVTTMIHLDMLEKLDHSKLPNVQANLIESLKHPAYDPKQEYAIPYVWGITGIAYNKKYVKDPITSWAERQPGSIQPGPEETGQIQQQH